MHNTVYTSNRAYFWRPVVNLMNMPWHVTATYDSFYRLNSSIRDRLLVSLETKPNDHKTKKRVREQVTELYVLINKTLIVTLLGPGKYSMDKYHYFMPSITQFNALCGKIVMHIAFLASC